MQSLLNKCSALAVSFALAFSTAYNIKHDAPWISQVGKGSSLIVASQHDDYSPPA